MGHTPTSEPEARLRECIARCAASGDYLDTFYEVFLGNSQRARDRFAKVDLEQQKRRLAKALPRLFAIADLDPDSRVAQEVRLSHRQHHQIGAPTDYGLWIESLCETLKRHEKNFDDAMASQLKERLQRSVLIINPEAQFS